MAQIPMILKTALTGRWVCLTRYTTRPDGVVVGQRTHTHDVHDQIEAVLAADRKRIGANGCHARRDSMTPERRSEIARKAARARWDT